MHTVKKNKTRPGSFLCIFHIVNRLEGERGGSWTSHPLRFSENPPRPRPPLPLSEGLQRMGKAAFVNNLQQNTLSANGTRHTVSRTNQNSIMMKKQWKENARKKNSNIRRYTFGNIEEATSIFPSPKGCCNRKTL